MKAKLFGSVAVVLAAVFIWAPLASAHVAVTPAQATTADRVTFSVSVPNEKDVLVTEIRLTVPTGVTDVAPTVHPGWTIETTKEKEQVASITWKGGEIPAGQRDDFTFRAQAPEKASEIQWKAYQTYADDTTVSWDQAPGADGHEGEGETAGPYSVTKVTDVAATTAAVEKSDTRDPLTLGMSLAAIVLSLFAILQTRKKS